MHVVSRCSTNQDLSRLLHEEEIDRTVRFRAAEKLLDRHDRQRHLIVPKCSSNFDRFLKEQHRKRCVDWHDRGFDTIAQAPIDPHNGRSKSLPLLTGLPSFQNEDGSLSASIASSLCAQERIQYLYDDLDISSATHFPECPNPQSCSHSSTKVKDRSIKGRVELASFYEKLEQYQDGTLRRPHPRFQNEEEMESARIEKEARDQKRKQAYLRLLNRSRLRPERAPLNEPCEDKDDKIQPGLRFFKWIQARDPALGAFMPATLVVEQQAEGQKVVAFITQSNHAKQKTTVKLQISPEDLATASFQQRFVDQAEKPHGAPLFVLKLECKANAKSTQRLLFSHQEVFAALERMAKSLDPGTTAVLQQFVRSTGKRPWSIRLVVNEAKGVFQPFTLTSRRIYPDTETKPAGNSTFRNDAHVAFSWTAGPDFDCTDIVPAGATTKCNGVLEQPILMSKAILSSLWRTHKVRFQMCSFDYIKSKQGDWKLIQLGAFKALERPLYLRQISFAAVRHAHENPQHLDEEGGDPQVDVSQASPPANTPNKSDTVSQAERCPGSYCNLDKDDRQCLSIVVDYRVIAFDRLTKQGLGEAGLTEEESAQLGSRVRVCEACAKVYSKRKSTFSQRVSFHVPSPTVLEPELEFAQTKATRPSILHSKRKSSGNSLKQACIVVDDPTPVPKAPYSTNMLTLNSSLYQKMVAEQRSKLKASKPQPPRNSKEEREPPAPVSPLAPISIGPGSPGSPDMELFSPDP